MRFLRRSLIGLFLFSATFGLLALAGGMVFDAVQQARSDDRPARTAQERVYAVNTVALLPESISPRIETFGEIKSRRTLELRAPAAGEISWLNENFESGARVSAGTLLARLDDRDAMGRLATAEADLNEALDDVADATRALALARDTVETAKAQADLQERSLARQSDLLERGVGSASAVETAELALISARSRVLAERQALAAVQTRLDQAQTMVERRELALAEAERRLADTRITARFDGVLANVTAIEGGLVSVNEPLAELIDPDALEVAFRLSAAQYVRLLDAAGELMGAEITASLDVSGIALMARGRITRDAAQVGDGQSGRELFASIDAGFGLRPGDFVTVTITEPVLTDVVLLPATALDADGTLLLVGEDDRLERVPVTVLRRQRNDVIVRVTGFERRLAVAERTPFLGEGIKVRPLSPQATSTALDDDGMVTLDAERRARLVAFVEDSDAMPEETKERVLARLRADRVPAEMVNRLEARIGG